MANEYIEDDASTQPNTVTFLDFFRLEDEQKQNLELRSFGRGFKRRKKG